MYLLELMVACVKFSVSSHSLLLMGASLEQLKELAGKCLGPLWLYVNVKKINFIKHKYIIYVFCLNRTHSFLHQSF